MGLWDRVRKNLKQGVAEGVDVVKEGAAIFSERAGRMAKKGADTIRAEARRMASLGQLRYQRVRLNQQAHERLAEIGGRVYDLASKNPKRFRLDAKSQKMIMETKKIEGQIKKLDGDIRKLSKGSRKK